MKKTHTQAPASGNHTGADKLQKLLANAGLGSRREMEQWIVDGRIMVNGRPATLGMRVTRDDRVSVDGKPLAKQGKVLSRPRVILYHKPEGVLCTRNDPKGRQTVYQALPRLLRGGRWVMVGRLDINTSGVLLLTTDGDLAHRLMHPAYEMSREYAVRIFGEVSSQTLETLQSGVMLEGQQAGFETIRPRGGEGRNHWFYCCLREGRNREVRKLWEAVGCTVSRLIRIGYAGIILPRDLPAGKALELAPQEVNALRQQVGLHAYHYPASLLNKGRRSV